MLASAVLITPIVSYADDYYDDDIYFDESKAKKKKTEKTTYAYPQSYSTNSTYDYGSSMRDVDEYNRQGAYYATTDSIKVDSAMLLDGYTYTNRIERFYNPNIVSGSGDQALIESYSQNQPIVNIYVDDYFYDPYPYDNWRVSVNLGWSWGWG